MNNCSCSSRALSCETVSVIRGIILIADGYSVFSAPPGRKIEKYVKHKIDIGKKMNMTYEEE